MDVIFFVGVKERVGERVSCDYFSFLVFCFGEGFSLVLMFCVCFVCCFHFFCPPLILCYSILFLFFI